jgi:hypothetical protein
LAWALPRHCSTAPGVLLLWHSRHCWPSLEILGVDWEVDWEKALTQKSSTHTQEKK